MAYSLRGYCTGRIKITVKSEYTFVKNVCSERIDLCDTCDAKNTHAGDPENSRANIGTKKHLVHSFNEFGRYLALVVHNYSHLPLRDPHLAF